MSPQQGSGEKTEKATPKKRRDARERGQVLKSTEINTAFCCVIIFGFMLIFSETMIRQLGEMLYFYLGEGLLQGGNAQLNNKEIQNLFVNLLFYGARVLLPILLVALLAGLLINVLQVGFLFTTKALMPKLDRISPIKGFQRIFSLKTLIELLKCLIKITVLGIILYNDFKALLTQLPSLMGTEVYNSFTEILRIAFRLALKMTLALAIIAAFDFLFQWWNFEKELRMTKQEIKDEYKLMEGDPQIKGKIRQKQRQMSAQRMMAQVPSADVVITNPTHYAVALSYKQGESNAPVVVAKGQDYLAKKIKEIAAEHRIDLIENIELARSLYQFCEVGDEIPPEFYQAVADILVYVFRQKNKLKTNR